MLALTMITVLAWMGGCPGSGPDRGAGLRVSEDLAVQSASVDLTCTLYTEALEPIQGGTVLLRRGSGSRALSTSSGGHSQPTSVAIGSTFDLYLREGRHPQGLVLGQGLPSWVVPPPSSPMNPGAWSDWELVRTQPVLRPAVLDASVARLQFPEDPLWALVPSPGSSFAFPAEVGSASDGESVGAYFTYHGITPPESTYRYAFAVHVDGPQSLGQAAIALLIDAQTLGLVTEPSVDVFHVAPTAPDLGTTSLSIDDSSFRDGTLALQLGGELGAGTTLVLLYPTTGVPVHGAYAALSQPPAYPKTMLSPQQGASPNLQEATSECKPVYVPPKTIAELCTPDPPTPNPACPQAPQYVDDDIVHDVRKVGDKVCGSGYFPQRELHEVTDWGASLSLKFEIKGVTIKPGGHYAREEETKTTIAPGSGNGCGECVQLYKRRSFVKVLWRMEWPEDTGFKIPNIHCIDAHRRTGCVDGATVLASCPLSCD